MTSDVSPSPSGSDPEAGLRWIVEHIPAVLYIDSDEPEPDSLYISPHAQTILGYPPSFFENAGKDWVRVIHKDDRAAALHAWRVAFDQGTPFDLEYRYVKPDGTEVWVHDHAVLILDQDGNRLHWRGVLVDITDRMHAERELAASEALYRSLVKNLPAVVYIDSDEPSPRTIYITPNVETVMGYSPARYLEEGDLWTRLVHPADRARVLDAWAGSVERGDTFDMEYRSTRADGREIWVHDHAVLARDGDGNGIQWQGVLVDITERVHAERELATSEARYRALVEGIPAVVYEMGLDDHRRTLYASPHIEALFGYTRGEWLDQQDIWMELLHPDDREIELAAHDLHSSTGEPWAREYRLIAADGRIVWVRDHAMLLRDGDGNPMIWQGVMVDVTGQKQAEERLRLSNDELEFRVLARTAQLEEANELMTLEIGERRRVENELRAAEERFRHLVEDLPAVVYRRQVAEADDDRDHSYASPQIDELLGITASDWRDDDIRMSRVHPHDRDTVTEAWMRSRRTGEPFEMQYRTFHKDGRIVSVFERATMLARNQAGEPFLFQGVLIDLTAQRDAERKAAEAEERFRELVELSPVVPYSFIVEPGEQLAIEILYTGPQMSEILGLPRDAWNEPARWFELVHPDDRDRVVEQTRVNAQRGEPWDIDYRMIAADGGIVWLNDRGRCTQRDEIGRPIRFQGVVMDVTSRRLAEDILASEFAILRELVDGMPAIPWTHTVDAGTERTRYLFMGKQSFELLGYTADELIAEPYHFPRLVHPDDLEHVKRVNEESDRTGVWDDEYRVIHRDGSVRWIHGVGRRVTPAGWDPATWQGVTLDVTARHANEEPPSTRTKDQMDTR